MSQSFIDSFLSPHFQNLHQSMGTPKICHGKNVSGWAHMDAHLPLPEL